MSPLEAEIVKRKLAILAENLRALEPIQDMTEEEYLGDLYRRKATERLLQELIEAAIDINLHLIVQAEATAPDDYYESFIKAGELGIISTSLAMKLAPSAGLRNRLVHEYDQLDHLIVLKAVKMAVELYPRFVREISHHVARQTQ